MNDSQTTASAPVRLAELALELGESVDALEHRLGRDVFRDATGFRCVTRFRAGELIEERDRRTEAMRRQREATRERVRAMNLAHPVPRGINIVVPEGATPAAAMVALDGQPLYDGGRYVPAPTFADWKFGGAADSGGTIGPDPRARRKKKGA